jgi:hypothetical protein
MSGNIDLACPICDFRPRSAGGRHLHEVRSHGKPQRHLEGRNIPSPWDTATTDPTTVRLWAEVDRLRDELRRK